MVLDWDTRQYNAYCRIEWPRSVKVVAFRKYERAKVQIPCRFKVGFGSFMGEILDLSVGGCRFQTANMVDVGVEASIHFTLPDGMAIDPVYCVVRNVQSVNAQTYVGCEFMPGQVCVESHIAFFITNMLERSGTQNAREHEVLIIDDDPARAAELRRVFQLKGYSALVATGMLDGLARLRSKPPEAALIRARQKELPGITAARLLRVSQGFETIPVFLHDAGENDSILPNDNNVRGMFPVGASAIEVVNRVSAILGSNSNSYDFLMSPRSTPSAGV
jgi:CheY-like chemotaxis protein